MAEREIRSAARGLRVTRFFEHGAAQSERGNHQPIPGGENLIVQVRAHTRGAGLEQRGFGRLQPGADLLHRTAKLLGGFFHAGSLVENVATREFGMRVVHHVAALRHAVAVSKPFGSRRGDGQADLIGGPDVECAFSFD